MMEVVNIQTTVILAMHGIPPKDYPKNEIMELFKLHAQLEHMPPKANPQLQKRHDELDKKIRNWPRTKENDPYWNASNDLGEYLEEEMGLDVIIGFNEFCGPSLVGAIEEAISNGSERIVIVTSMMTPGGEHSEIDIPNTIKEAEKKYPEIEFIYAWPFDMKEVAEFLAKQIKSHL